MSDPERLTDWWPRVQRVEDASRKAWTTVMVTPKGRTLRADFTLLEADHPRLLRWRQEVEESPFERILEGAVTELELKPAGDGETDVRLDAAPEPARPVSARRHADSPGHSPPARGRARRPGRAGAGLEGRLMRWWGWGEDSGAISLPEPALAMLREELGLDGSHTGSRVQLDEVQVPAPALPDSVRRRPGRGGCERRPRRPRVTRGRAHEFDGRMLGPKAKESEGSIRPLRVDRRGTSRSS